MIFRATNLFVTTSNKAVARRSAAMSTVALHRASASTQHASSALLVAAITASLVIAGTTTHNHCQVPCGIFDDPGMVAEVTQAATTVRKAMVQSQTLWEDKNNSIEAMNQVVRWIATKEEHCDKIIRTMGDYCLCQRVKPASFASKADYLQALELHHTVMQAAMKAKQTMDVKACDALDHALADLAKMYS